VKKEEEWGNKARGFDCKTRGRERRGKNYE
jgi:hypothetical protein